MIPVPQKKGRGRPRKYLRIEDVLQWRKQQKELTSKLSKSEKSSEDKVTIKDIQQVEPVLPQQILEDQQLEDNKNFQLSVQDESFQIIDDENTLEDPNEVFQISNEEDLLSITTLAQDLFHGFLNLPEIEISLQESQDNLESGAKKMAQLQHNLNSQKDSFDVKCFTISDFQSTQNSNKSFLASDI